VDEWRFLHHKLVAFILGVGRVWISEVFSALGSEIDNRIFEKV
jgi:hypothetical protein